LPAGSSALLPDRSRWKPRLLATPALQASKIGVLPGDFQQQGCVMCGIVGFSDKIGGLEGAAGRVVLRALEALACRGPDGTGVAILGPEPAPGHDDVWSIRIAPGDERPLERLARLGQLVPMLDGSAWVRQGSTLRFRFLPEPWVTALDLERALGARRGGLEVLSLGRTLDLVKQVGSPSQLETAYAVSTWTGRVSIGHTRLSTESRIDLSHSQPFWVHGTPDLATVHNGHVTNYHQLRRRYEQQGVTFYTDNDSEVIGVYLRDRMSAGRSLPQAMADSIADLDGAYNYLVASCEGLGIVRDRFGFKPLMLLETEEYVATATEEIALRRAFPGDYRVVEPPPGEALFYPIKVEHACPA
jgi:glutamine phosphoribosylpyrophosphate amidotransferase